MAGDLADEGGRAARLRRVCLYLFAGLPLVLLVTRVGAEIVVAFIGISFLAVIAARRRWDVLAQPLVAVPIAIWLYLMAVNAPLAGPDMPVVLGRAVPWLRFFCLFGAAVFWLFAEAGDFRKVAFAWGATLAFVVVDGIAQGLFGTSLSGHELFGTQRLTGPLDRPNIGKYVALLFFPGLAAYLLSGERRLDRRRAGVLAAATAAVPIFVLFTGERAALVVSVLAGAVMVLALMALVPRFRLPGILAILAVVVVTGATVMTSPRLQARIEPTLAVLADFLSSPYGELARTAIAVWRVRPATGVGVGNFKGACDAHVPDLVFGCLRHPHNIYLEWLAEGGAIGLAAFLVFVGLALALASSILRLRRERPVLVSAVLASPVVTLFPLVPTQSFFSNWPAMLWWSSLALTCAVAFHALRRKGG